ncbi:hypothetical protein BDP27DRAFT_1378476 [Rhodocollybia butyracea]|uniref:Uncharacterized protein n=1 Tax=Rhodocollybia butyracea TaxID=206335 RepID=A0A9P5P374_9AGAR|nr:hypothetical protein BDP27DRAFT_1378476 [Rhodocollybia butyracea]
MAGDPDYGNYGYASGNGLWMWRGDWHSICLALKIAKDLQGRRCRRLVTTTSLKSSNSTSYTLTIPTPTSTLPASHPPPSAALRLAFRRYPSHVDNVICILEVLHS